LLATNGSKSTSPDITRSRGAVPRLYKAERQERRVRFEAVVFGTHSASCEMSIRWCCLHRKPTAEYMAIVLQVVLDTIAEPHARFFFGSLAPKHGLMGPTNRPPVCRMRKPEDRSQSFRRQARRTSSRPLCSAI
jgi:hypothetical protein